MACLGGRRGLRAGRRRAGWETRVISRGAVGRGGRARRRQTGHEASSVSRHGPPGAGAGCGVTSFRPPPAPPRRLYPAASRGCRVTARGFGTGMGDIPDGLLIALFTRTARGSQLPLPLRWAGGREDRAARRQQLWCAGPHQGEPCLARGFPRVARRRIGRGRGRLRRRASRAPAAGLPEPAGHRPRGPDQRGPDAAKCPTQPRAASACVPCLHGGVMPAPTTRRRASGFRWRPPVRAHRAARRATSTAMRAPGSSGAPRSRRRCRA